MASDDPKRSKEGTTAPGSTGSSSPEQQNQPANDGKHTSPATPVEGSFPNANAPRSDWPLPSTHEYEPWTKNKNSSSPGKGEAADNFTIPSIVTLTGRPSPWPSAPNRVDERCVIYCTQTAARRVAGEPPICKTWCYRRLFPHDYSPVGQSARVKPDGNSGRVGDASGYSERPQKPFAFDGKYVYFGRSRYRARNRMYSMSGTGLPRDPSLEEMMTASGVTGKDPATMDRLRQYYHSAQIHLGPLPSEFRSALKERVEMLIEPIVRVTTRYAKSFEAGGAQERFSGQLWEKMKNGDTLDIAKRVGNKLWENFWDNGKGPSSSKGGANPP